MMDLFRCWLIKVDLIVDGIFLSIAEKNFYPLLFLAGVASFLLLLVVLFAGFSVEDISVRYDES